VVDLDVDPLDARRRRRRAWLRIGVPVACVGLMIAAILAISLYADRANRRGVLTLTDEMLATLELQVSLRVEAFLVPAGRAVRIVGDTIEIAPDPVPLVQSYAFGVLREVPQISLVSLADEAGDYWGVRRLEHGGYETKVIRIVAGARHTTLIEHGPTGDEISRADAPDDGYDPRTRGWYQGARTTDAVFWTDPYIFFSSRAPGVTASTMHRDAGGRGYFIGLDIRLAALSDFLATLKIGQHGRAVLIDGTGKLVAAPVGGVVREVDGQLVAAGVDQLDDPGMTRAYDLYRVEGAGRRTFELGDERYITTAAALESAGRGWALLVVVPESDFTGFVESNNRNALAMSLVVVALAALLGALLVRQGLRADRGARRLLDRQHALDRQSEAFARLAGDSALFDTASEQAPRALTETLATVAGARRASIWAIGDTLLRCADSFDRDTAGHVDGLELHRDELSQLFGALCAGETIDVPDAARDRRTAALHRAIMSPLGTRALLAVPVRRGERVVGSIWLEDARPDAEARTFVRATAHMVAPRLDEVPPAAPRTTGAAARAVAPAPAATRSFAAELRAQPIDTAGLQADLYPAVAVMTLLFSDPEAMAARIEGARALSDEIACALQEIAATHDVPYLKLFGHEVVAAVGFGDDDADAPLVIADLAVALRDRCIQLYEDADRAQDVRIGIDCGAALGCAVGREPRVFNLWGDAVRAAHAMAASAVPGTVQVTEAAYQRLRHHFLFRPRGRFYMPRVGESRTYVLATRL
jgi:GAF domain-containing protein